MGFPYTPYTLSHTFYYWTMILAPILILFIPFHKQSFTKLQTKRLVLYTRLLNEHILFNLIWKDVDAIL